MSRKVTVSRGLPNIMGVTSVPPFVTKLADILKAHAWFMSALDETVGSQGMFFGLQHPPVSGEPDAIGRLAEAGIGMTAIAYELCNVFGGGFAEPTAPLTDEGKKLIDQMDAHGMYLDLSHAGHQTALDALDHIEDERLTNIKVCASHGGCHAVYPHLRNLPDAVLSRIASLGGLIGLTTVTWMLDERDNGLDPFFRHFDHLLKLVGQWSIAIGSDGVYQDLDAEQERRRFEALKDKLDPRGNFKPRLPDQPAEIAGPHLMTGVATAMGLRRYGDQIIENVCGANLARFAFNIRG